MKIFTIVTIFLLLLSLTSCAFINSIVQTPDRVTATWQTVTISGIGAFKLPTEWNVEERDGFLYVTDRPLEDDGYTIYLVGAVSWIGKEPMLPQPHEVFEGVEKGEVLLSLVFRNGAWIHVVEYIENDVEEKYHLITLANLWGGAESNEYDLLIWNGDAVSEYIPYSKPTSLMSISSKTPIASSAIVEQIALTFRANSEDYDNPDIGRLKT
jgi:hypothetical protein